MAMQFRLSKRERYAVSAAVALGVFFLVLHLMVLPLLEKKTRLSKTLVVKSRTLDEMLNLQTEYRILQKKIDRDKLGLSQRQNAFTLFSFLDRLAGESGLKDYKTYMKPTTSTAKDSPYKLSLVELKLQAVDLQQLTGYLYRIENSENRVYVKRISISKPGLQSELLDVILQVETIEA
ncbi:MAG: hypothetical protein MUP74_02950 [Desulfobacterales bacterium]|nr:hypothetical protein [Desulfobacterales bacterium]